MQSLQGATAGLVSGTLNGAITSANAAVNTAGTVLDGALVTSQPVVASTTTAPVAEPKSDATSLPITANTASPLATTASPISMNPNATPSSGSKGESPIKSFDPPAPPTSISSVASLNTADNTSTIRSDRFDGSASRGNSINSSMGTADGAPSLSSSSSISFVTPAPSTTHLVTTTTGVSFGMVVVFVAMAVVVVYIWQRRDRTHSRHKPNKSTSSMLVTHTGSECDTTRSSHAQYMRCNLAGQTTKIPSTPWDDDELLVVRVPLEAVRRDQRLSSSGSVEVYRGVYHGRDVAIKSLLPSKSRDLATIKSFQAEIKLMVGLEHPRIVKFVAVAWDSLAELCVLTELMPGGDLTSLLAAFEGSTPPRPRGFDLDKIKIALHVSHALTYLHSLETPVLHRDLKSKNILLDAEWNAKVTDFGVSRERVEETMTSGIGSTLWMAPEVMLGERYDEKADMFSFGVVLSELDTQQLPYAHRGGGNVPHTTLLQLVTTGDLSISLSDSPAYLEITQLARDCVSVDPNDRPTAPEALHRIHCVSSGR